VSATRKAARSYWQRGLQLSFILWVDPEDLDGPQAGQAAQWPQAGQGLSAMRQAAKQYADRSQRASRLLYQRPSQDVNEPLPTQPDTWQQPVQGVSALKFAGRNVAARARRASLLLYSEPPQDLTAPLEETWTQFTQGTRALRQASRAYTAKALAAATLYQQTEHDTSDPSQPIQEAPWTSPVAGNGASRAASSRYTARSVQAALLYSQPATDLPPVVVVVEAGPQSVQGVQALQRAQQAFRQHAGQATLLSVNPAQDDSGPQGTQPETWTQAVQGTQALAAMQRAQALRASIQRGYASNTGELNPPSPSGGGSRIILIDDRLALRLSSLIYVWLE
jgi:hypothetical protein